MNPNFLDNISAMSKEFYGKYKRNLVMTSGYRSSETQAALYKDAVAKYGASAGSYVAPPGRSLHEKGIAADINFSSSLKKDIDLADNTGLLAKYGLYRPLKNAKSQEHWHIEPIGSRKGSDKNAPGDGLNNPAAKPTPKSVSEVKDLGKKKSTIEKKNAAKPVEANVKKQEKLGIKEKSSEPVVNKEIKEQKVSEDSVSLAEGTNSREASPESTESPAESPDININKQNESSRSQNVKNIFRKIINGRK
jgi:hypothetical protein